MTWFQEILPLVEGILRCASLINIWIVGIRHDGESQLAIKKLRRVKEEEAAVRKKRHDVVSMWHDIDSH